MSPGGHGPDGVSHLSRSFFSPDEDSNLSPSPLRDLSGGLGGQEEEEEEQRWLDALEKGELDDNGDLKKEINERLLTARQVSCFLLFTHPPNGSPWDRELKNQYIWCKKKFFLNLFSFFIAWIFHELFETLLNELITLCLQNFRGS